MRREQSLRERSLGGDGLRPWLTAAGIAGAVAGIAYLLFRAIIAPKPAIDFRFFWAAGKAWAAGLNPYGPGFEAFAAGQLPDGNAVIYWFYPPQWWGICRALALLDFDHALILWRLLSGLCLYLGATVLVLALTREGSAWRIGWVGLACAAAALIDPSANLLAYGQSSALTFLALCLIAAGLLEMRGWMIAVGLLLALLKPQLGALIVIALLVLPRARIPVLVALIASLLLALPHFAPFGVVQTARQFLGNLDAYGKAEANGVIMFAGPLHLLARLVPVTIDAKVQMLIALPLMLWAATLLRNPARDPRPPVLLLFAAICALVPLHTYDLTILLIPLALAIALRCPPIPIVFAAILLVRPTQMDDLLGVTKYGDGLSRGLIWLTLSALTLLVLALIAIRFSPPTKTRIAA